MVAFIIYALAISALFAVCLKFGGRRSKNQPPREYYDDIP